MSTADTLHRFLSRFVLDSNGCWQWQGKPNNRYGRVKINGQRDYVHRVTYRTFIGPIPDGLTIDHLCRNTMCGNPNHLEVVDGRTNILRGTSPSAIAARRTHCPQGHPYDEDNTYRYPKGGRACRACHRAKALAHYYAKKEQK